MSSDIGEVEWIEVGEFGTRAKAVSFAQRIFNANARGEICLLSESGTTYSVEVPNPMIRGGVVVVERFWNKEEAIEYARRVFGCDEKGTISIVYEVQDRWTKESAWL